MLSAIKKYIVRIWVKTKKIREHFGVENLAGFILTQTEPLMLRKFIFIKRQCHVRVRVCPTIALKSEFLRLKPATSSVEAVILGRKSGATQLRY